MSDERWFVTDGHSQQGPLSLADLRLELSRPVGASRRVVWREGMKEWAEPDLVPELSAPPVPPAPRMPELNFGVKHPAWFLVGGVKLAVMSVVTLGLYQIYWFHKQWTRVRDCGDDVHPLSRAVFSVVFCHSLFGRIVDSTYAVGVGAPIPAGALTVAFILGSLSWRAPGAIGLLGFLSVVPLVLAQRVATAVALRQGSTEDRNTRLSPLNWAGVVVGGLTVLLAAVGLLFVDRLEEPTSQVYLSTVATEVNKTLPKMLDGETQLVDTMGADGVLVYHYRLVKYYAHQLSPSDLDRGLRPSLVKVACETPSTRDTLLKHGVTLRHVYGDKEGHEVVTIDVVFKDCPL